MHIAVRAPRIAVVLLVAVLCGCGAATGAGPRHAPARQPRTTPGDTFRATVTGTAGRRLHQRGSATVLLMRGAADPAGVAPVTILFHGTACRGTPNCVRIQGRLTGHMTLQHSLPDVGRSFRIAAAGSLTPMGRVTATGDAAGTGFTRNGHTRLNLTLSDPAGAMTVQGISPLVPGFTQP